ncbi:MAG: TetR/AcrR family transcriptional regulator [Myxococcota bacterium]
MTTRSGADKARAIQPRERILEAAETLFARHGLERTTLADIARRAHLSKATLYHHFPEGKESIFQEAVGAIIENRWERLLAYAHAGATPREQLRRYLSEGIATFDREIMVRSIDPEVWDDLKPWVEHALEIHVERERGYLREILVQAQADGTMPDIDPDFGARLVQAVLHGVTVDGPVETTAIERGRETDQLIEFIERGLGLG